MTATSYLDACGFFPASSGTGDFVVSAAITGYQTPASAAAVNATVYSYRAESADKTQWEEGFGAYTVAGTTLARTTVTASSTGAKVSFSAAPNVFITALSADLQNASLLNSGSVPLAQLGNVPAGNGLVQVNYYTTTQTITIPAGVTRALVKIQAPGGGSGSWSTNFSGGGGSGSYLEKYLTGLTATNTLALTMGAVGAAGVSSGAGGAGGTSTLASGTQTISTLTTNGGLGSPAAATTGAPGNGGAISTGGDLNLAGRRGVVSGTNMAGSGGAGFIGGDGALGANAATGNVGLAGSCIIEWYS